MMILQVHLLLKYYEPGSKSFQVEMFVIFSHIGTTIYSA